MQSGKTMPVLKSSPVVIIGAGRSGTNILRNVLATLDAVATWPCDEINYIWRYGNRSYETDELNSDHASWDTVAYIRNHFKQLDSKRGLIRTRGVLLEKTCANSLRVEFVNTVLPEAKFIFLVRDGRDVVSSAIKRWKAPIDIPYLAEKTKFVPVLDIPYYATRYLANRIKKIVHPESQLSFWGPKFEGWQELVATEDLASVCAHQWSRCVDKASNDLLKIDPNRVCKVKYEEFVRNPIDVTNSLVSFMGIDRDYDSVCRACDIVSDNSVGKGSRASQLLDKHLDILEATLKTHGYS